MLGDPFSKIKQTVDEAVRKAQSKPRPRKGSGLLGTFDVEQVNRDLSRQLGGPTDWELIHAAPSAKSVYKLVIEDSAGKPITIVADKPWTKAMAAKAHADYFSQVEGTATRRTMGPADPIPTIAQGVGGQRVTQSEYVSAEDPVVQKAMAQADARYGWAPNDPGREELKRRISIWATGRAVGDGRRQAQKGNVTLLDGFLQDYQGQMRQEHQQIMGDLVISEPLRALPGLNQIPGGVELVRDVIDIRGARDLQLAKAGVDPRAKPYDPNYKDVSEKEWLTAFGTVTAIETLLPFLGSKAVNVIEGIRARGVGKVNPKSIDQMLVKAIVDNGYDKTTAVKAVRDYRIQTGEYTGIPTGRRPKTDELELLGNQLKADRVQKALPAPAKALPAPVKPVEEPVAIAPKSSKVTKAEPETKAEPVNKGTYGDWFTTPDGRFVQMRGSGGIGSERVSAYDVSGEFVGRYNRNELKFVRKEFTPDWESMRASDSIKGISGAVSKLEREHEALLLRAGIRDRFDKELAAGKITSEQYDKALKTGVFASDREYKKAVAVRKEIQSIKDTLTDNLSGPSKPAPKQSTQLTEPTATVPKRAPEPAKVDAPEPAPKATQKEPWEMTREEYLGLRKKQHDARVSAMPGKRLKRVMKWDRNSDIRSAAKDYHESGVLKALSQGKRVPDNVVDEFLANRGKLPKDVHPEIKAKYAPEPAPKASQVAKAEPDVADAKVQPEAKAKNVEASGLNEAEKGRASWQWQEWKKSQEAIDTLRAEATKKRKEAAAYRKNNPVRRGKAEYNAIERSIVPVSDKHDAAYQKLLNEAQELSRQADAIEKTKPYYIREVERERRASLTPIPRSLKVDASRPVYPYMDGISGQRVLPVTNLDKRTLDALGVDSIAIIPGEPPVMVGIKDQKVSVTYPKFDISTIRDALAHLKQPAQLATPKASEVARAELDQLGKQIKAERSKAAKGRTTKRGSASFLTPNEIKWAAKWVQVKGLETKEQIEDAVKFLVTKAGYTVKEARDLIAEYKRTQVTVDVPKRVEPTPKVVKTEQPKVAPTDSMRRALVAHGGFSAKQIDALAASLNPIIEQNPGAVFKAVKKIDPSGKLLQEYKRQMVAIHNTRPSGVEHIAEMGGIPHPSLAVVPEDIPFENFGNVSFIAKRDMINPEVDTRNAIFDADVYSQRQPRPTYTINSRDAGSKLRRWAQETGHGTSADPYNIGKFDGNKDRFARELNDDDAVQVKFLESLGYKVEPKNRDALRGQTHQASRNTPDYYDKKARFIEMEFGQFAVDPQIKVSGRNAPYTLDNVSAAMGTRARGRESTMTQGLGKQRAKLTKRFSSLDAAKSAQSKIVDKEAFAKVKEHQDALWDVYSSVASSQSYRDGNGFIGFHVYDSLSDLIGDMAKGKPTAEILEAKLEARGFRPTSEQVQAGVDLAKALKKSPTEYFESKLMRPVLNREWAGVVVPKDAPAETFAALEKAGISDVRTYDSNIPGDRLRVVQSFKDREDVFFQQGKEGIKGAYNPSTRVIELVNGKADVSTVIHEVAHDWHGFLKNHAEFGPTIKKVYGDSVEGAEKFARHFEGFLRTGKAPSKPLAQVFAAIREWMAKIYSQFSGGKAPKEVEAIFKKAYENPSEETLRLAKEFDAKYAPKPETKKPDAPGTGINRADQLSRKEALNRTKGQTHKELEAQAKKDLDGGYDVESEFKRLAQSGRPATDREVAIAVEQSSRLRAEQAALNRKLSGKLSDEEKETALESLKQLDDRIASFNEAIGAVRSATGRSLSAYRIKQVYNWKEFKNLAEFKDAVNAQRVQRGLPELSDRQTKTIEAQIARVNELEKELESLKSRKLSDVASSQQNKWLQARNARSIEAAKAQRKDASERLKKNLKEIASSLATPSSLGSAQFEAILKAAPELIQDIKIILRSYVIEKKMTNYGALAKSIRDDFPELDPSESDIRDVLAGRWDLPISKNRSTWQQLRDQAKREVTSAYNEINDIAKKIEQAEVKDGSERNKQLAQKLREIEASLRELDRQETVAANKAYRSEQRQILKAQRELLKDAERAMRNARSVDIKDRKSLFTKLANRQAKLDDLQSKIDAGDTTIPKPKPKAPVDPVIERLDNQIEAAQKELKRLQNTPERQAAKQAEQLKKRLERMIDARKAKIRANEKQLQTKISIAPTKRPKIDERIERLELQVQAGNRRVRAMVDERDLTKFQMAMKVLRAPQALAASIDISAPGRQGFILSLTNPKAATKAFSRQLKALASESYSEEAFQRILNSENAHLYKRSGLYIADPIGTLTLQEEAFLGNIFKWQKYNPVRASERAYVTYLNSIRTDVFDRMVKQLGPEPTDDQLKAIADYVNVASGRGAIRSMSAQGAANFANLFAFSARYQTSRVQYLLGTPTYRSNSAGARKLIVKEYAKFIAAMGGILGLAKGAGILGPDDPTSSDFLKLKIGETRIDLLAGMSQWMVFASRLGTGKHTRVSGETTDLRSPKYGGKSVGDVVEDFARSKANPQTGAAWDVIRGRDYKYQKPTMQSTASSFLPISVKELVEGLVEDGMGREDAIGLLNFLGFGVNTFDNKKDLDRKTTKG